MRETNVCHFQHYFEDLAMAMNVIEVKFSLKLSTFFSILLQYKNNISNHFVPLPYPATISTVYASCLVLWSKAGNTILPGAREEWSKNQISVNKTVYLPSWHELSKETIQRTRAKKVFKKTTQKHRVSGFWLHGKAGAELQSRNSKVSICLQQRRPSQGHAFIWNGEVFSSKK